MKIPSLLNNVLRGLQSLIAYLVLTASLITFTVPVSLYAIHLFIENPKTAIGTLKLIIKELKKDTNGKV